MACRSCVILSELYSTESIQTGFWSLSRLKSHKAHFSNASDAEAKWEKKSLGGKKRGTDTDRARERERERERERAGPTCFSWRGAGQLW